MAEKTTKKQELIPELEPNKVGKQQDNPKEKKAETAKKTKLVHTDIETGDGMIKSVAVDNGKKPYSKKVTTVSDLFKKKTIRTRSV